jgi:hypothetical protein
LLEGEPSCFAADFKLPQLRRCPFDPATIDWNRSIPVGGGLDGYVWKVWFGQDGPYALKVVRSVAYLPLVYFLASPYCILTFRQFWQAEASECNNYFALQRECQNAAILQMIETQMKLATAPIVVNTNPVTKSDALHNLVAFSRERIQNQSLVTDPEVTEIPAFPRMAKCYGWLEFGRQLTRNIPRKKRAPLVHAGRVRRFMSYDKDYIAIVYEYIEEGSNNAAAVEAVDRFLWLVGFCHTDSAARNWRSGVLVDHSAIVYPRSYGWFEALYKPRKAGTLLRP